MDGSNIILTRIDNRLVHGQVGITWTASISANTIVVIDDEVFFDGIRQKLMESVAHAAKVDIRFYTVDDFVKKYHEVESNQKLFIVVKTPHEVRRLVDAKIDIRKVNVGNLHYERNRVAFNRKVYLSEQDVDDLNHLLELNVNLFYQDIPGMNIEKISHLNYEDLKRRR